MVQTLFVYIALRYVHSQACIVALNEKKDEILGCFQVAEALNHLSGYIQHPVLVKSAFTEALL